MSNYRTYSANDDQDQAAGDSGFRGVDMRDAGLISEGMVASAENMRFVDGQARGRNGIAHVWQLPDAEVRGAGQFDDPVGGVRWLIVVVGHAVWRMQDGGTPWEIPVPSDAEFLGRVQIVQAFDRLFLFRGEPAKDSDETAEQLQQRYAPLAMANFVDGFKYVTEQTETEDGSGTGTEVIQPSRHVVSWANRLIEVVGDDGLAVSDALNYTRYSVVNSLRINAGSGDRITGIYPFGQDALVVAKERSVHVLANLVPNEYGNFADARRVTVAPEWGIVAPRSLVQVGADVWGLSRRGVVSVRQTETNAVQAVDEPISAAIHPLIQRINWAYAAQACAIFHENRYYLAVPLDKAEIEREDVVAGAVYDGAGSLTLNLVPGRWYRYAPGAFDAALVSGGQVYQVPQDFQVPATGVVTLLGERAHLVTATLKPVFLGVNNVVLVFNTKNGAWEGCDRLPMPVLEWVRGTRGGEERIYLVSDDGSVSLYEEGWEDEVYVRPVVPYLELTVGARPVAGDYLKLGGSVNITANRGSGSNTASTWGAANLELAGANLWRDRYGVGGYNGGSAAWAGPVTERITAGIRLRNITE